jgi:hypothetical protein
MRIHRRADLDHRLQLAGMQSFKPLSLIYLKD